MTPLYKTLNLLTEILDSIEHFEDRIDLMEWSNEFGLGQECDLCKACNLNDIHTYSMCIDRLNERFNKYKNTL